jgi:hypothetical protein
MRGELAPVFECLGFESDPFEVDAAIVIFRIFVGVLVGIPISFILFILVSAIFGDHRP